MIQKVKNFFLGSYEELRRVVWPSRKEVTSHTIIVIISTVVSVAIIAAIDYGLFTLMNYLINNRG